MKTEERVERAGRQRRAKRKGSGVGVRRAIESSQKVSLGYVRQKSASFWSNRTWPFNPDTIIFEVY